MKKLLNILLLILLGFQAKSQINDSSRRLVTLDGAVNFRDLGGYETNSGKKVITGKIYRSGEISKLSNKDLMKLQSLRITKDFDFRGLQEAGKAPDKLWDSVSYIRCGAGSETVSNWMTSLKSIHNGDSLMQQFYGNIDSLGIRYKPLFQELLVSKSKEAILFHCTAGKDRTGIAAALILHALGVSQDIILADYEASNFYRKTENEKMAKMIMSMGVEKKVADDMMGVKASYLLTTWNALIAKFGSIDNFLLVELGIGKNELKQLRKKYLN